MKTLPKLASLGFLVFLLPFIVGIVYPATLLLGTVFAGVHHAVNVFLLQRYEKWLGVALWLSLLAWGSPRLVGTYSYDSGSIIGTVGRVVLIVALSWVACVWVPRFVSDIQGDKINKSGRAKQPRVPRPPKNYNPNGSPTPSSGFQMPAAYGYRRGSVSHVGSMSVYGDAGSNVARATKFGGRAQVGAEGERIVAGKLSRAFSRIPGSKLFNGVKFNPNGSSQADVDHALVLGNNLYLVDAKKYKAGSYTELPGGKLIHDADQDVRTIKMEDARNLWARSMPGGTRLAPKSYVAVEGNNTVKRLPGSPVFMGSTEEVINEIQRDYSMNKFRGGDNSRLSSFVQSKMLK